MLGVLNVLVQFVALGVSVYLAITQSWTIALKLALIVGIGHFLTQKIADLLMRTHQRLMPKDELQELEIAAIFQNQAAAPKAWTFLTSICSVVYICAVIAATIYFLSADV